MNKIHIGYPKTATTFLQSHVFPQLESHKFIGHSEFRELGLIDLVWKADRSINYHNLSSLFKNQASFVSFEDLSGPLFQGSMMIDEMPRRLAKIFGNDSKILITIRRQDKMIQSVYVQYIHQGGTLSLKSFLKHPVLGNNRIDLNAFNYYETYERYRKVFGGSNVIVIPYELLLKKPEKFFMHLDSYFENENLNIPEMKLENQSLSGWQLFFLRNLNRFLQSPISEKYIIPPTFINQSKLRFKWQKTNIFRTGNFFKKEDLELISLQLHQYEKSNEELDNILNLDLKNYCYY